MASSLYVWEKTANLHSFMFYIIRLIREKSKILPFVFNYERLFYTITTLSLSNVSLFFLNCKKKRLKYGILFQVTLYLNQNFFANLNRLIISWILILFSYSNSVILMIYIYIHTYIHENVTFNWQPFSSG